MGWILPVVEGLANMMEIITFIQFIEEEAIQSSALGTFLALRSKSWRGASLGISRMRVIVDHLETINDVLGWAAPYSKGCFYDFVQASRTNLEIYDDLLFAAGSQYRS